MSSFVKIYIILLTLGYDDLGYDMYVVFLFSVCP